MRRVRPFDASGHFLRLTGAVGLLMLVASAAGVTAGPYRDNAFVQAAWFGTDLVTLVLVVPLLSWALLLSARRSPRGVVLAAGTLAYALYNYAFYLFGASFNRLFLVYVAILALSLLGLIAGLTSPEVRSIVQTLRPGRPDRLVGVTVVLISLGLGALWVTVSARSVITGQLPSMVTVTEHPTNITAALDLTLVVTFGLLGGRWLIDGKGWGYVISAIWLVKGSLYMTALAVAVYVAYRRGATESIAELGLWVTIGALCAAGATVLFRRSAWRRVGLTASVRSAP